MHAHIYVKMDNAAFTDDPTYELSNALLALSRRLRHASPDENFPVYDANGNKVGECTIFDITR